MGLGLVSGILSGMFGVGGAIITTPGIRLILGGTAMDAVATPLVGVIPSSITGAYRYIKEGITDWRFGLAVGLGGAAMGVLGAFIATSLGGTIVMVGTALVLLFSAAQTFFTIYKESKQEKAAEQSDAAEQTGASAQSASHMQSDALTQSDEHALDADSEAPVHVAHTRLNYAKAVAIGAFTGVYAGFFGLGGGVIIVPALNRFLNMNYKQAIGTSLLSISIISVPALAMHAYLGNVNWLLALGLVVGVVPGAWVGAKITVGASERATSIGFAVLLIVTGIWLGVSEVLGIR